jgi:ATP-dependent exoDNAse (exonuclease V) alpha subunit
MNQKEAFKILKSKRNVFLTGSPGTGKTFLLNKLINYLKGKKIKTAITASTGIAATHIEGKTIHSWAGIGLSQEMTEEKIKKNIKKKYLRKAIREAEVLIIDEVSMLDSKRFDLINKVCRIFRNSALPFGGIKVVLAGDFFQLPPVSRKEKAKFAFQSYTWQELNLKVCYLTTQYRHQDKVFISILNKIRSNKAGRKELKLLKERLNKPIKDMDKPTKLYTHNFNVDLINRYELDRINKKEFVYNMNSVGSKKLVNFLRKSCLAPQKLRLKKGAIVMFVKNNFEKGYVNGTLGKIVNFKGDFPIVRTRLGAEIKVKPAKWNLEEEDEILASIKQFPLRLAWAITVHKSQGMSLDVAEIDLSKSFEYGMGYVALSRVKSLEGIRLMGINEMGLRVNPDIVEKDKEFRRI